MAPSRDRRSEQDALAELADEVGVPLWARPHRRQVALPDGRLLSQLCWGEGGPDVVLLHGGAQNAHTWDSTVLHLRRSAVALDLAGHGHSSWRPDASYRHEDLADDVIRVLEAFDGPPPVLVGMSLGGLVAMVVAARRPELVCRLVVVDVTPGVGAHPSPNQGFVHGQRSYADLDELLGRAMAHYPNRNPAGLRRGLVHNTRLDEDGRLVWRHHFGNMARPVSRDASHLWAVVGEITVPTLLVLGGESGLVSPEDLARFELLAPHAQHVVVPGAGHSVQGSHPRELAGILDAEIVACRPRIS